MRVEAEYIWPDGWRTQVLASRPGIDSTQLLSTEETPTQQLDGQSWTLILLRCVNQQRLQSLPWWSVNNILKLKIKTILLFLPHPFPLLCGVDVSYALPPLTRLSFRNVFPDVFQPPHFARSSSPFFPRHLHRHHSLACVFFFSIHAHSNLRSCTFLDISPTFVVPLIFSFQRDNVGGRNIQDNIQRYTPITIDPTAPFQTK